MMDIVEFPSSHTVLFNVFWFVKKHSNVYSFWFEPLIWFGGGVGII